MLRGLSQAYVSENTAFGNGRHFPHSQTKASRSSRAPDNVGCPFARPWTLSPCPDLLGLLSHLTTAPSRPHKGSTARAGGLGSVGRRPAAMPLVVGIKNIKMKAKNTTKREGKSGTGIVVAGLFATVVWQGRPPQRLGEALTTKGVSLNSCLPIALSPWRQGHAPSPPPLSPPAGLSLRWHGSS